MVMRIVSVADLIREELSRFGRRSRRRRFVVGLVVWFVVALVAGLSASCAKPSPPYETVQLDFKEGGALEIEASAISFVDESVISTRPPSVLHQFPLNFSLGMKNWTENQLVAVGGEATVQVKLNRQSVVVESLPTNQGFFDRFRTESARKYVALVDVTITLETESRKLSHAVSGVYEAHEAEGIDENDRARLQNRVVNELLRKIDFEAKQGLRSEFGEFIVF